MSRAYDAKSRNGASHLMEMRLSQANLDLEYLEAAKAEIISHMREVCANCPCPERCEQDLGNSDWETGQEHYCPNAAAIDAFILGRM